MYRLLNIAKDTYVQNKIIVGSGSITSNVGNAGTLDLFKIYTSPVNSGSSETIENSRILIQADLRELQSLTGTFLDVSDSSFRAYLSLKKVYGGQTTPSNFRISLLPIAKFWDEGRGIDIKAFRDLDAANWVTASVSTGTPSTWAITGANAIGNLGDTSVDVWASGNLGSGSESLERTQLFNRGDEDLLIDVTTLVSATLGGIIPDYGWRLSFSGTLETDTNSYFVKRFGSRHTSNPILHPKLIVLFDENLQDDGNDAVFGSVSNKIRTYNSIQGQYMNWMSGTNSVTGSSCATLILVASKSISYLTSSFEQNFSASITYTTSSLSYFSSSFTVSQSFFGNNFLLGFYESDVLLNPQTDLSLAQFLSSSKSVTFQTYWKSNDLSVLYSSGSWLTFTYPQSTEQVVSERNFVTNITNLKNFYTPNQKAKLRVFVQDRNTELPAFKIPTPVKSKIFKNMLWRIVNAFSREIVIPFDSVGTRVSSDGFGMYFDCYMQDLDENIVYEFEFQIIENEQVYYINNEGFRFKVVS